MIKLYDLVFEDIEKNNIDLGDKTQEFNEKLELMLPSIQEGLIDFIGKLNDSEKKELGSLLNKYSSVDNLKGPKTPLELKIARLEFGQAGPGEILFHLELQDSTMVGDTTHDLMVKGKVWEVKKVENSGGPFRGAKEAKLSKFKFSKDLLIIVTFIDDVVDLLPKLGEDFEDISPELFNTLKEWNQKLYKFTPKETILRGELSKKFRNWLVDAINTIKKEIEVNTDDEFTYVKFGGVNVGSKEKGIDPVNIQRVDDDTVTLNFIGRDTLTILEKLNEMPYVNDGDFEMDLNDAVAKIVEDFPSLIAFSLTGKIAIIPQKEVKNQIEIGPISQGGINLQIKKEFFQK
jgi:hypothetical protein